MSLSPDQLQTALERSLDHHLRTQAGETPGNLDASIRYSLLAPGKRIRPRLLLTAAEMLGLPQDAALGPALALEMLHCFTLIHDDLPCMDNDDFRRGKPSNHKVHGEAIALLAGDALMALSTDVFLDSRAPADRVIAGLRRFLWAAGPRGVMGGQAREGLLHASSTLSELRVMHAGKTGALFSAAILVPMDLAGITETSTEGQALSRFAAILGEAFQVADDLEDGEKEAKKPTSVLFYLSPAEAAHHSIGALSASCEELRRIWGARSSALLSIALEVSRAIERFSSTGVHTS